MGRLSSRFTRLSFGVETSSNHNQSEKNVFHAGEIEESLFPAYLPPVNGPTNDNGSVTDSCDHFEEVEEENGEKNQSSKRRKPIDVQAVVKISRGKKGSSETNVEKQKR